MRYDPVNADGRPDLVVANNGANHVSVLLGNGASGFGPAINYATRIQPRYIAVADLDGDGRPDLAVSNNGSNSVSVLPGNGDGTFAAAVDFATGPIPNDVKAADFNGDGKPDLVTANFGGGSISILVNQAASCAAPAQASGTVVEFYNAALDNFFITADPVEQAAVAGGAAGPGWCATGDVFKAGGPAQVCRFYGSLAPGPNSHFYTIDPAECQALKDLQAATPATQKRWNFESTILPARAPRPDTVPAG